MKSLNIFLNVKFSVNYNLVMYKRVVNKETNLGNMYFENTYNNINIHANTIIFFVITFSVWSLKNFNYLNFQYISSQNIY